MIPELIALKTRFDQVVRSKIFQHLREKKKIDQTKCFMQIQIR